MAKAKKIPVRARPSERERRLETEIIDLQLRNGSLERSVVALGRRLVLAEQQLANREGYIERVWDREELGANKPAPDDIVPGEAIEKLRRVMAYSPDREASAIIDVISPDLMERVLGKSDESGF